MQDKAHSAQTTFPYCNPIGQLNQRILATLRGFNLANVGGQRQVSSCMKSLLHAGPTYQICASSNLGISAKTMQAPEM
jgi:hypothetical protein